MKLNEARRSSIKLLSGERSELRSASEASPFSFKCFAWVSSHLLEIAENLMLSVGSSRDMLGIALKCWNLLHSVPKLIKSRARFPFFVKAGYIKYILGGIPLASYARNQSSIAFMSRPLLYRIKPQSIQ